MEMCVNVCVCVSLSVCVCVSVCLCVFIKHENKLARGKTTKKHNPHCLLLPLPMHIK